MSSTTMQAGSTALRALVILATAALIVGGCRSDGGVGRRDAQRSLTETLDMIERNYERDVKATRANMERISGWFERETSEPWREINRTVNLYLEGDTRR
jgi:hypothetical protein